MVRRAVVRKQKPNVLVIDAGLGNIGSVVTALKESIAMWKENLVHRERHGENYSHVILQEWDHMHVE